MNKHWLKQVDNGIVLRIIVQTKASKTKVVGLYGDPPRLKIKVAAPPFEGRANEVLIKFLSKLLNMPASRLAFLHGLNSRIKDVLCVGASEDEIASVVVKSFS
ncbi:MAG: DUF167 domain-containing protein [Bdellovibrionota bacterium]